MAEPATYDEDPETTMAQWEPNVQESPTPLPKFQLFLLMLVQFAEPVTSTVIFPFIPQLVRESGITHGDEKSIGYYAGMIVRHGFFSISQKTNLTAHLPRRNPSFILGNSHPYCNGATPLIVWVGDLYY